ncbi:hypothetical protein [Frankia sp. Cr1]|uniref:hypothetical protein n=1 Tax=Frankia sp. Cr1 TaxID=3073931 RepID=UPI002AD2ADB7|nr:hypothetical protein [Frankia sp. Cr1]
MTRRLWIIDASALDMALSLAAGAGKRKVEAWCHAGKAAAPPLTGAGVQRWLR